jgi:hypothetical protein
MFGSESHKANMDLIKKCLTGVKNVKMAGLIKKLIQRGVVTSDKVCNSMLEVDRGEFCDPTWAYSDS